MFVVFTALTTLLLSALPGPWHASSSSKSALVLDEDRRFTIAIFADLHYGEEEHGWGIDQDIKSARVMNKVLAVESPDFAVINGDLITGENTFRENSSQYVHQIVRPLVEHNLRWASTYGNHDSKFNLSREALFETETSYSLSYTTRMNPDLPGITNYYLLIYNATKQAKPVAILWFFDSRGGANYQHKPANQDDIPNWVDPKTADWFRTQHSSLKKKYGILPSIAFVHIPPHPFLTAQKTKLDPSRFPGVNDDVPLAFEGDGTEDSEFVDALLSTEGLHSIYVGHDHGNAWCSLWPEKPEGPFLCFSKHSAYGGYGTWNRGVRMLELTLSHKGNMSVETWVRMEDGSIVTRVSLNETYGQDTYPSANGE